MVTIEEARDIARQQNLDLVEVDPNARPIVCKILDWGKAKFELSKKEKAAKRHEKTLEIKQVKFRPGIDDHDFDTKLGHARRFLEEGKRTKVTVMFRRRDLRRPENGRKILDRVVEHLGPLAKVETKPLRIENRDLTMVLVPALGVGHALPSHPPTPRPRSTSKRSSADESKAVVEAGAVEAGAIEGKSPDSEAVESGTAE